MHQFLLAAHNTLRWAVVLFLLIGLYQSFTGWFGKRKWEAMDKQTNRLLMIFTDLQLLAGLLLYFVFSPASYGAQLTSITRQVMRDPARRFWVVEHFVGMLLAVILIHLAVIFAKRPAPGPVTHKRNALFFLAAAIFLFATMPWPFRVLDLARPWFRINFL